MYEELRGGHPANMCATLPKRNRKRSVSVDTRDLLDVFAQEFLHVRVPLLTGRVDGDEDGVTPPDVVPAVEAGVVRVPEGDLPAVARVPLRPLDVRVTGHDVGEVRQGPLVVRPPCRDDDAAVVRRVVVPVPPPVRVGVVVAQEAPRGDVPPAGRDLIDVPTDLVHIAPGRRVVACLHVSLGEPAPDVVRQGSPVPYNFSDPTPPPATETKTSCVHDVTARLTAALEVSTPAHINIYGVLIKSM